MPDFVYTFSTIECGSVLDDLLVTANIEKIEDCNALQSFPVHTNPAGHDAAAGMAAVRYLRVTFGSFSDFYGRVTLYSCEVFGHEAMT